MTVHLTALVILAVHAPLVAWLWDDDFRTLNRWADWVEDTWFPAWFQWSTLGDRVSWLHHAGFTALGGLYGALWAWVEHQPLPSGAVIGALCVSALYLLHRVGWAVDGIMDVLCPLGVTGWAYTLWWVLR